MMGVVIVILVVVVILIFALAEKDKNQEKIRKAKQTGTLPPEEMGFDKAISKAAGGLGCATLIFLVILVGLFWLIAGDDIQRHWHQLEEEYPQPLLGNPGV